MIEKIGTKLLGGEDISREEALALVTLLQGERRAIRSLALELTSRLPREFDTCSIVNARSGRCPENCKWCAQSAHYDTKCDIYPVIGFEECKRHADLAADFRIKRFSMVTSGRKMHGRELTEACSHYRKLASEGRLHLCASMGLLGSEDLQQLWDSGVRRYHCNLEAEPAFFSTLCSTHTVEDKIRTIEAAREIGFEICSGGIIGMGESMEQRVLLALELRRVEPVSIPINVLCPIPGTPLENMAPLSAEEVLDTVALFRLIHPRVTLRFAGGRGQLSRETQLEAIRLGVNGAIVGDLLTTLGSTVEADRQLIAEVYGEN